MSWSQSVGNIDPVAASIAKVFSSEFYIETYQLLMEIIGQSAYLTKGSPGAILDGTLERLYKEPLMMTFGGGTNEIQRDLIGVVGLGLPRAKR
jgi:acyl-CoA dehydrogenase